MLFFLWSRASVFDLPVLSRCNAIAELYPWHVNTGRKRGTEGSVSVRTGTVLHPRNGKGFYWTLFKYLKVRVEISISVPNFCLPEFPSFSFQSSVWAKGYKKKGLCETKETKDKTARELWTSPNLAQTNLLFWIFKGKSLPTWQTRAVPKKRLQPVVSGQPEKSFHTANDSINYIYSHFISQPEAAQTRAKWTVTKMWRFYTVGL